MKLTKEQAECIGSTGKWIRNILLAHKSMQRFNVGDFMIMKSKQVDANGNISWKTETFGKFRSPRKFKVVALDEYNVPFYKEVLHNGKLSDQLRYAGNMDITSCKFLVDPDLQDFILIGGSVSNFDPMKSYKQTRGIKV